MEAQESNGIHEAEPDADRRRLDASQVNGVDHNNWCQSRRHRVDVDSALVGFDSADVNTI